MTLAAYRWGGGRVGVSVQNEPRSGAPGWHKGMAQIMEPDPGQLRPFQHSAEHV